jgi:hypothetical protein
MSSPQVFFGVWRSHEADTWILTLSDRDSGIISAGLILFVGFVASQAWNAVKFVVHQARATDRPRDGLYHQQQLALRNSAGHLQMLWISIRLSLGWKRQIGLGPSIRRSWLLAALSLVSLAGWSIAQLYVSVIWTGAGDQYLLVPSRCGLMFDRRFARSSLFESLNLRYTWFSKVMAPRLDYASSYQSQCSGDHSEQSRFCDRSPVHLHNWEVSDGKCPFTEQSLCISTNSTPVIIDSGFINSNTHLGINAPRGKTIEYRKIATCSPMDSTFTQTVQDTVTKLEETRYYYGPSLLSNDKESFTYSRDKSRNTSWSFEDYTLQ